MLDVQLRPIVSEKWCMFTGEIQRHAEGGETRAFGQIGFRQNIY